MRNTRLSSARGTALTRAYYGSIQLLSCILLVQAHYQDNPDPRAKTALPLLKKYRFHSIPSKWRIVLFFLKQRSNLSVYNRLHSSYKRVWCQILEHVYKFQSLRWSSISCSSPFSVESIGSGRYGVTMEGVLMESKWCVLPSRRTLEFSAVSPLRPEMCVVCVRIADRPLVEVALTTLASRRLKIILEAERDWKETLKLAKNA